MVIDVFDIVPAECYNWIEYSLKYTNGDLIPESYMKLYVY